MLAVWTDDHSKDLRLHYTPCRPGRQKRVIIEMMDKHRFNTKCKAKWMTDVQSAEEEMPEHNPDNNDGSTWQQFF